MTPAGISSGWAEAMTLGDLLLRAAAERPDGDAAVLPEARATYAQLPCAPGSSPAGIGVAPGAVER